VEDNFYRPFRGKFLPLLHQPAPAGQEGSAG